MFFWILIYWILRLIMRLGTDMQKCGLLILEDRSILLWQVIKILAELAETLKSFSYRILKDDCLDLPPKTYMKRIIQLTPEQKRVYGQMKQMALAELKGKMVTTVNVITQLMRLQQITCGHFKADDGSMQEIKNNRIDELMDVLEELEGKALSGPIGVMILPLL